MAKEIPNHLRLVTEEPAPAAAPTLAQTPGFADFLAAFELATGWRMRLESEEESAIPWSVSGDERPAVQLVESANKQAAPLEIYKARKLADALGDLLGELQRTRHALWQREAELAAGVPVASDRNDGRHLAVRLQAVLKGGAEAVSAQAAALYLLDDATTQLKLRACWGLSRERLLEPARPLRGAVADLEALVGHAVVIEDAALLPHWRIPEACRSAVCVPVSSSSEPLGTLWVFCDHVRTYSDEQTNLLEIIAGRVASELQREMLLRECVAARAFDRQVTRAIQWQQARLPNVKPLLDDWQLAGARGADETLSGDFYDWLVPPDGSLAIAAGGAEGGLLESALTAASLQSLLRAQIPYSPDPGQTLAAINETFWNSSAGGQFASLGLASINPETGAIEGAVAGHIEAFVIGSKRVNRIPSVVLPLGTDPEVQAPCWRGQLDAGQLLVILSRNGRQPEHKSSQPGYVSVLQRGIRGTADELIRLLAQALTLECPGVLDWSAIIAKRLAR